MSNNNQLLAIIGGSLVFAVLAAIVGSQINGGNRKPAAEMACDFDWRKCTDNGALVTSDNADYQQAQFACKKAAQARAKYGNAKFGSVLFGTLYRGDDAIKTGIATLVEDDAQFQNGFGAYQHVEVVCKYNLADKKIVSVDVASE